jgi:hypothetical protein
MEIDENGIARARHPNKDDRVMAYAMALMARWESISGILDLDSAEDPFPEVTPSADRRAWKHVLNHGNRSHDPRLRRVRGSSVVPSESIPWE